MPPQSRIFMKIAWDLDLVGGFRMPQVILTQLQCSNRVTVERTHSSG